MWMDIQSRAKSSERAEQWEKLCSNLSCSTLVSSEYRTKDPLRKMGIKKCSILLCEWSYYGKKRSFFVSYLFPSPCWISIFLLSGLNDNRMLYFFRILHNCRQTQWKFPLWRTWNEFSFLWHIWAHLINLAHIQARCASDALVTWNFLYCDC